MGKKLSVLAERPDEAINTLLNKVVEDAKKSWSSISYGGLDPQGNQFGRADLRPTHLGLTNSTYMGEWTHPAMSSGAEEDFIASRTVHVDSYVLIHGWFNNAATPNLHELKFYFGGNELGFIHLDSLYSSLLERKFYFEQGFGVSPSQTIRITGHNSFSTRGTALAARTEQTGPIGEVVAKRSYVIQYNAPTP